MTAALQERIGYRFRDDGLLKLSLTHPSVLNQSSNQRLEFLGDSVLGAVVARIIYDLYPNEKEGELARRHSVLVSGPTLTQVARDIALGDHLHIGTSEVQSQGRENASNLEDALEALIGAIFLDGGFGAAEQFITSRWTELAKRNAAPPKDSKTALQEWAQARSLPVPIYRMTDSTGPSHAPLFTIEVTIQGYPAEQAQASSKRAAEQVAAGMLLEKLAGAGQ